MTMTTGSLNVLRSAAMSTDFSLSAHIVIRVIGYALPREDVAGYKPMTTNFRLLSRVIVCRSWEELSDAHLMQTHTCSRLKETPLTQ